MIPELTITESELRNALRILSITNSPERDASRIMHVVDEGRFDGRDEAFTELVALTEEMGLYDR